MGGYLKNALSDDGNRSRLLLSKLFYPIRIRTLEFITHGAVNQPAQKRTAISAVFVFVYISMIVWTMLRNVFKGDSQILHRRVCERYILPCRNTNNAAGKITPQWRLSPKDLGQPGSRAVS